MTLNLIRFSKTTSTLVEKKIGRMVSWTTYLYQLCVFDKDTVDSYTDPLVTIREFGGFILSENLYTIVSSRLHIYYISSSFDFLFCLVFFQLINKNVVLI